MRFITTIALALILILCAPVRNANAKSSFYSIKNACLPFQPRVLGDDRSDAARQARYRASLEFEDCLKQEEVIAANSLDANSRSSLAGEIRKAEQKRIQDGAAKDFHGLKLGAGVGFAFGFEDRVDEAVIADGIVRVSSSRRNEPRLVFEGHNYMACDAESTGGTGARWKPDGCGPFFAITANNNDVLGGVGLGWMFGYQPDNEKSSGWSIGIGAMLDGDVFDLAEGFSEDQPPPGMEETVRLEKKSRVSLILFVSNTF